MFGLDISEDFIQTPPPKKKKIYIFYQKRCVLTNFDMFYIFEFIQELHFLYVVQGKRKHHHENRV